MTRNICYITGTRADFGLMRRTLEAIAGDPALRVDLLVSGMHLSTAHGHTVDEIEQAGFTVRARVPITLEPTTGATMARNVGLMTTRFTELLDADRPDIVLLLGDRGEMLAGAIAALHLNIAVAHVHGGERSGTVDEPVRHAISKLAHFHFVATEGSRERLVRMGEAPRAVFVTGAPGLDGLCESVRQDRATLCRGLGLDPARPVALMVFHPVLQEADRSGLDTQTILAALRARQCQILAMAPNADAGSEAVRTALNAAAQGPDVRVLTHLLRDRFIDWMAACDLMVGNSSAGIIEAASFGTPVLNLGSRQHLRERNLNVIDVSLEEAALVAGINAALRQGRYAPENLYGDGRAAARIVQLLASLPIGGDLPMKTNAF